MTPFEENLAAARSGADFMARTTVEMGNRASTWLIVGNAGALGLVFNALMQGTDCNPVMLENSAWFFGQGLAFAFTATLLSYLSGLAGTVLFAQIVGAAAKMNTGDFYVRELEQADITVADDSPLEVQKAEGAAGLLKAGKDMRWVLAMSAIIMILYLCSTAAFARGLAAPLAADAAQWKACAPTEEGVERGAARS